jgi:hypothetical protein
MLKINYIFFNYKLSLSISILYSFILFKKIQVKKISSQDQPMKNRKY